MVNTVYSPAGASNNTTTATAPFGGGLTEIFDKLDKNFSDSPTGIDGSTGITRRPIGKLVSSSSATATEKQNTDRIQADAVAYTAKCWKTYAKLYPEAFSNLGGLGKKTPQLIFLPPREFGRAIGSGLSGPIAFVKSGTYTPIYVNTKSFVRGIQRSGPEFARFVLSHELIHSLTYPVNSRAQNDISGKTSSYRGVKEDLELTFNFKVANAPGGKDSFSLKQVLMEFAAEHYCSKATGLRSISDVYAPIRDIGSRLIKLVGENVFRKAMLGNDLTSYRQIVQAATVLRATHGNLP